MSHPFDGYFPKGPVPGRPWWRALGDEASEGCRRDDGLTLAVRMQIFQGLRTAGWGLSVGPPHQVRLLGLDIDLGDRVRVPLAVACARLDRVYPRRTPPPLVGQVWSWGRPVASLLAVTAEERLVWSTPVPDGTARSDRTLAEPWPPPGAVLVYGPRAPWAPSHYLLDEEVL